MVYADEAIKDSGRLQVDLYAEYDYAKLMDFLRASNYYSLEKAFAICEARDLVPEMVFLLGRMGNNKTALGLIIERMGDVQRVRGLGCSGRGRSIDRSHTGHRVCQGAERPRSVGGPAQVLRDEAAYVHECLCLTSFRRGRTGFIRGLLENVGADIDPVRLIRRIKNGLEIPGLKQALIKILQDFNLQVRHRGYRCHDLSRSIVQISLMDGCESILFSDCRQLSLELQDGQASAFFGGRAFGLSFRRAKSSALPYSLCTLSTLR
jgi:hypothetical protein